MKLRAYICNAAGCRFYHDFPCADPEGMGGGGGGQEVRTKNHKAKRLTKLSGSAHDFLSSIAPYNTCI